MLPIGPYVSTVEIVDSGPIRLALRARVVRRQERKKISPKQPLKIRLDSNYQSGIEVNGLSSILH